MCGIAGFVSRDEHRDPREALAVRISAQGGEAMRTLRVMGDGAQVMQLSRRAPIAEIQQLEHRFVASRCADEGFPKPHPDMLLNLMACCRVEPSRTLMIGDTSHDLELARNAGASALAVTYGAHAAEGLAAFSPLAMASSIAELSAWLRANG